jgi:uncharacterized protein YabN with tetrapyrrole methylase and pyrophosphatase domain
VPEPERPVDRLLAIMRTLRDPEHGCEWDVAQTFATIAPYTIEEAYEVADAIARGDLADLKDELGDLLLQVVFHARVGFDWPDPSGPRAKIDEELAEIDTATTPDEVEDEIGDLLFTVASYARHRGVDPEAALRAASAKFERRFRAMETADPSFASLPLDAKEALWSRVKNAT